MKNIVILAAAASTLALTATAQIQLGDESVMEPLVQGGLVDGGIVDGEENMEIDPDMMDRTPDYMPDTSALDIPAPEVEGEPATTLVPNDKMHMPYVKKSENGDPLPKPMDKSKDADPKVMPEK
jgi:hypothetical protein